MCSSDLGPWRYADAVVDRRRARLIVVREDHSGAGREPVNALVAVSVRGDGTFDPGTVLVEGADFYSTPRLSADGTRLCWLSWSHPNMPWDGTELWVADVSPDGRLAVPTKVAGGREESIYQPDWWPDGTLCFASDRTGWWLLYRWRDAQTEPVLRDAPPSTEFGKPQWLFGTATWASAGAGRLVVSFKIGRAHV